MPFVDSLPAQVSRRRPALRWAGMVVFGLLWAAGVCAAESQLTVEPPSWWVGMHDRSLQLMLHAPGIADARAETQSPGIQITAQHRLSSPNYLFVDLDIHADAKPGTVSVELSKAGQLLATITYPLKARRPGSADRQGFGPADTIYLLVPDRFANGNPDNDNTADTLEKANRRNPGGRHGGDIAGMRQALGYLHDLGITQIWPTPLVENNMAAYSYHGYAATDLYRIDPRFGSNQDYRDFVAAAADRGIGVIQDIVLNHIGSNHRWLSDPPSPDWINGDGKFSATNHARTTVQDPYAADVDRDEFLQGWFVDTMPDLNQRNPFLATYLIQNSLWWIEYADLSGIREDTYPYSDPAFLATWSKRIVEEYPNFSIVGEEWSRNPTVVSHWQAGDGGENAHAGATNSMMDFPLYYELVESMQPVSIFNAGLVRLYQAMVNDRLYAAPQKLVLFDGNHDTSRLFSLLDEDESRFRAALVYLFTAPRTPQLFYGTEIAMTGPKQRDDGGTRADFPGGWAGDKVNAITGTGLSKQARSIQGFVRQLLQFRKTSPALAHGKMLHFVPQQDVYVYARISAEQTVLVVINAGNAQSLSVERFEQALQGNRTARDVLSNQTINFSQGLRLAKGETKVMAWSPTQGRH